MNTLIIHPPDLTTDFLKAAYPTRGEVKVVQLHDPDHLLWADRVVCLGHGTGNGLFSPLTHYEVHDRTVPMLTDKELVLVWCYASEFARKHELKALCAGMFISEVHEAAMLAVGHTKEEIDRSNKSFAEALRIILDAELTQSVELLRTLYKLRYRENTPNRLRYTHLPPVVEYNMERLKYNSLI